MKKNILILGAHGMLGRTMFFYLSSKFPHTVWGTIRELSNEKNKFFLSVGSYEKDIQTIFKKIKHIDYIINCIAATDIDTDKTTLIKVNTNFPENIAQIAERKKSKLIHVSTDGVFSELAQEMNESDTPFPTNEYTKSKLSGEPYDSSNALSIRTSLLGFDPIKQKGLLEWAIREKKEISGYTNQLWSGCTVLQFAQLVEKIIARDAFSALWKKSPVFHFAPITHVTKYQLIKDFLQILKKENPVKKSQGKKITRQLQTNFSHELWLNEFTADHKQALQELVEFEKIGRK